MSTNNDRQSDTSDHVELNTLDTQSDDLYAGRSADPNASRKDAVVSPFVDNNFEELLSAELKTKLKDEVLAPHIIQEATELINSSRRWRKVANFTDASSQVLAMATTILAFSEGFFGMEALSFAAGCAGTTSMALAKYHTYSRAQRIERIKQLNLILRDSKIPTLPIIMNAGEQV
jgi:hypothetical protein